MSQDTFPFAEGDDSAFAEEADRNRKAVLVAGGVAAALVLGAGGWLLLGGGGDDSDLGGSAFVPAKPRTVAAAPNKVAVKPAKKLPTAYKAPLGRDPFKALYVVPVAAPAAAAPTTTAPTTTAPTTTGTATSTTPAASTSRYPLKLVAISKPSPETRFTTWLVAGEKKTVLPAQRFGKFGEVVVLAFSKNSAGAVDRAIIQVGDDSPINVKIGETVSIL